MRIVISESRCSNSYSARKNPRGAIEAFRQAGLAGRGAALVVKVQNVAGNEADFSALQQSVRDLPTKVSILDYVVEHEVAHLEVLDHSSRFWDLLASRCPGWRGREDWLRRHGHGLRL